MKEYEYGRYGEVTVRHSDDGIIRVWNNATGALKYEGTDSRKAHGTARMLVDRYKCIEDGTWKE